MSRKIERLMCSAIRQGKSWRRDNTEVRQDPDACRVYLHGHLIAEGTDQGSWRWTLAGWNSNTTRSRINALARAFNWTAGVCSRDFTPYVRIHRNGPHELREIASDQWVYALDPWEART